MKRSWLAVFGLLAVFGTAGWVALTWAGQDAPKAESPAAVTAERQSPLDTLDWLVGDWVNEDETRSIEFNCHFTKNGSFLVRSFQIVTEKNVRMSGMQVIGKDDPKLGKDNLPIVGDRGNNSTNINVGDVNIGNSVDYSKNQKAWVDNHHATGNQVRVNAGKRYASAYNNGAYRHGTVGGYPYYGGWNNRGAYYGWRPVTYASFGTFMGAAWVSAQPRYYAYGTGGNVYYENNVVYVDGQPAGTPEEYAAQSTTLVASAPAEVTDTEWLPLGTFALTREGVNDSQAMLELAVNKQGVLAGTYYNEATRVSRSLKGMLDQASQRAAIGFADGKNTDVVLETGIQNLTQDEAPALLHQGKDRSGPVLLVRLQAPEEEQK